MNRFFLFLLIFLSVNGFSQNSLILDWEKNYGGTGIENLESVKKLPDGGFILGGMSTSHDGDIQSSYYQGYNYWVVKIDSLGNIIWEKTYGGNDNERLKDIQPLSNGQFLLAGYTSSEDGDIISGLKGGGDFWVVKITENGDILWEKTYGGSDFDLLNFIQPTNDGGFLLGGFTDSNDGDISLNNGKRDSWLIKIDSGGNVKWDKTFGGTMYESFTSILPLTNGNFILGGFSNSFDGDVQSGNKGSSDFWIVEIDDSGNIIWEKTYGGIGQDELSCIQNSHSGGYILGGISLTGVSTGSLVICIDSTGKVEWEKTYNTDWYQNGNISIHKMEDYKYLIGGYNRTNIWISVIDSIGDIIWNNEFGGTNGTNKDYLNDSVQISNTEYIIGGNNSVRNYDFWIFKLKTNNPPTDILISNSDINENEVVSTEVGRLSSIDEDSESIFTYSLVSGLGDEDNNSFSISGDTLLIDEVFNYETKKLYSIRIQTKDGYEGTFSKSFTISVKDINDSPSGIIISNNSVNENEHINTEIGIIHSIDEDSVEIFTYKLVSGLGDDDNNSFSISGDTLLTNETFDFETKDSYTIRIQTKDSGGLSYSESFTVSVNDINESPTDITLSNYSVGENEPINTEIGTLTTIDVDTENSFTYTLVSGNGDTDNMSFLIIGEILYSNEIFDYETKSEYSIRVRTKSETDSLEKIFTIYVQNDSITDISLSHNIIKENNILGTKVGIFSTTDMEQNQSYDYSLISGDGDSDNNSFLITGDTLYSNEIFDYETKSEYSIRVKSESGIDSLEKIFTILIQDMESYLKTINISHPKCSDDSTGSIELEFSELSSPYSYKWYKLPNTFNPDTTSYHQLSFEVPIDTSKNINNLKIGKYGLVLIEGEEIKESLIIFNVTIQPIFKNTNICYVNSDGDNVIYIDKGSSYKEDSISDSGYDNYEWIHFKPKRTHIRVFWRFEIDNSNVEKYGIYREGIVQNQYEKIGEINSFENYYTDSSVNNRTQSFSYKVTSIDSCGNESELSPLHSTIHLSQNRGISGEVNLSWTHYIGLGVPTYSIYRQRENEEFELLKQISSNNNTYTDFTSNPSFNYQYYISFEVSDTCYTSLNTKSGEIIEVKSNVVSTDVNYTNVDVINENSFHVYPNPVNDELIIETQNTEPVEIEIYNIIGNKIMDLQSVELRNEIDLRNVSTGVYLVHITDKNDNHYYQKIIKRD